MSFDDEKFFASWGIIFFSFLVLVNFETAPGFSWIPFLCVQVALGLFGFLRFRKDRRPSVAFYRWGVLLWSALFVTYSSFALRLVARTFGGSWLWFLIPLWVLLTLKFIRASVHWQHGATAPNTGLITSVSVAGAAFSGVLTFYVSKSTLMFGLTMMLDILLSFTILSGVAVWLRRLINLPTDKASPAS